MNEFTGFPAEALGFYKDIEKHNETAWFEAHRGEFMEHVIAPAQAFITSLGERLQVLRPGLQFDTNHTGRGSFKKIHTDRRFNKDRPPFKTYAQMILWEGPQKVRKENSCLLVHFDPDRVMLACGLKYFERGTLKQYRAEVSADKYGKALARTLKDVRGAGYSVGDLHYKRVPRGIDPEHPRGELLKYNAMYAHRSFSVPESSLHTANFVEFCAEHFAAMMPLHNWCVELLRRGA
jgi:uncharacterized protein (TIGR02453 family)